MFIKLKLKRNKYVKITPQNLKDIKHVMCIKDVDSFWGRQSGKVIFKKGVIYKFQRRWYNGAEREGYGFRLQGDWTYFGLESDHPVKVDEVFIGLLINRRKKKDVEDKTKVETGATV